MLRARFSAYVPRLAVLRQEIWSLVGIGIIAAGLWAFIAIADEVGEGETHGFDSSILLALRVPGQPDKLIGPHWLKEAATDITALGGFTVLTLITVLVIGFLLITRKYHASLLVAVSIIGGTLLSMALKSGYARPRPDIVGHVVSVQTLSFPSGHAMLSTITYLTLGALLMRIETERRVKLYVFGCAILLALIIGASRIYLGVHWPTDVLAGWAIGAAWALLCWLVAYWLQRKGTVEGSPDGGSPARP